VSASERTTCDDRGLVLLYPDIPTRHSVIQRMKQALV
jgi:hypothetical protein